MELSIRRIVTGVVWGMIGMALLAIAMTARAGDATLTWAAPQYNCDGSPVVEGELVDYRVFWGKQVKVQPAVTQDNFAFIDKLTPGNWWFSVSVRSATDESQFVTVEKTVTAAEFVTVGGPVYTLTKTDDRMLFVVVGNVAQGVQCDANQPAGKYFVVPKGSVTWTGSVRPLVVFADCG